MPKFKLVSKLPLSKHNSEINSVKTTLIRKAELYSASIPLNGEKAAVTALTKIAKCVMPIPGNYSASKPYKLKILRLSVDQIFLYFNNQNANQIEKTVRSLENAFYITEQSDAWAGVKVSGLNVINCLERICPIDLSIDVFGLNSFARTTMEHINTVIIRTKKNEFELFSPSSSAKSFLRAIERSAQNI